MNDSFGYTSGPTVTYGDRRPFWTGDDLGRIWMIDTGLFGSGPDVLRVLDSTGETLFSREDWGGNGADIAFTASGHALIPDYVNDHVRIFDANGTLISTFGESGDLPGQFDAPTYVLVGANGWIHVSDSNGTHVFDADWNYLFSTFGVGGGVSSLARDEMALYVRRAAGVSTYRLRIPDDDLDGQPDCSTACISGPGDPDGDGLCNAIDSCEDVANPDQSDLDLDRIGDACDPDLDGDAFANLQDNCAEFANPDQLDTDGDGAGDACDCAPLDDTVRRPDAVTGVTVGIAAGSTVLSWSPAVGADEYRLVRGSVVDARIGDLGDCVATVAGTSVALVDFPAPGNVLTYLVVGVSDACGQGSAGAGARPYPPREIACEP